MPFWKKSEDPWDWEPEQRPPSGAGAEQEDAPGILRFASGPKGRDAYKR